MPVLTTCKPTVFLRPSTVTMVMSEYITTPATGYHIACKMQNTEIKWTASIEFGTYHLCEQRRFRRACASAQSRQNLRCSLIQAVSQEKPSERKPDPWPLWMAGHAQLKFVMTECSKTQIRLTGPKWFRYSIILRCLLKIKRLLTNLNNDILKRLFYTICRLQSSFHFICC